MTSLLSGGRIGVEPVSWGDELLLGATEGAILGDRGGRNLSW